MDAREFLKRIRRTHRLQGVTIRFAKSGITGLYRLNGLLKSNSDVRLANEHDNLVILAVLQSRDWGGDRNRTYTLYGLQAVEDGWLTEIAKDVESIDVGDHGAKGIMSGRQKMREEATQKLIATVLTSDLVGEVMSSQFDVVGQLTLWDGIPCIEFRLSHGNELAFASIIVDGWSGRMAVNGKLSDELYIRPEQLQRAHSCCRERQARKTYSCGLNEALQLPTSPGEVSHFSRDFFISNRKEICCISTENSGTVFLCTSGLL